MASNIYDDELAKIAGTHLTLTGRSDEKRKRYEGVECFEEKLQKDKKIRKLIDHSADCIEVAEFLNNFLFHRFIDEDDEYLEDCIPDTEKSYIRHLLQKKKDVTLRALELSKENRQLEDALFIKKRQLKDRIEERNKSWNKAVKLFDAISSRPFINAKSSEYSDSSSSVSEENSSKTIYLKKMTREIREKYNFIQEISCILHKLIIFSGVRWANQKNLLDIVLFTGKIVNTTFNDFNLKKLNEFVIDCILKLDQLKYEHM